MIILSILSTYLPDAGDFFLLVISMLLGFITYYSRQHVSKMDKLIDSNTKEHSDIKEHLTDVDIWTKAVHTTVIKPAAKRSEANEKDIFEIKGKVKDHEGRIVNLEKKVK